jgi:voltage-dependent potassium channel beta subunit
MQHRILGNTGLKVSQLSYGSWITFTQLDQQAIIALLETAFMRGVNFFDTAEVYAEGQVENKLGDALKKLSIPREKYLLCTKVFWGGPCILENGLTRKHIMEGCHRSLARLKVDYLDFYLCHRPDLNTPIIETVIAMNTLIQQGKIIYWGTSEWPNELLIEAYYTAKLNNLIPPSLEQFEYNLFSRERGEVLFPTIQAKTGMGACATMPLACGILAGRYNENIPQNSRASLNNYPCFSNMIESNEGKNKILIAKKLKTVAEDFGITLPQLMLNWCLRNTPIASVIVGTTQLTQLKENLDSLDLIVKNRIPISAGNEIDIIMGNKPILNQEPSYAEVIAES